MFLFLFQSAYVTPFQRDDTSLQSLFIRYLVKAIHSEYIEMLIYCSVFIFLNAKAHLLVSIESSHIKFMDAIRI